MFSILVPYLAPEMTTSSFDVENLLGNRTVTIYWKVSGVVSEYNFNLYAPCFGILVSSLSQNLKNVQNTFEKTFLEIVVFFLKK